MQKYATWGREGVGLVISAPTENIKVWRVFEKPNTKKMSLEREL
jgi:hypothetical protein